MAQFKKIAFLFPGQGAQYPGMGKDFYEAFSVARETFEEADDLLKRNLSTIIFEGPEALLTETKNSQVGIYVVSVAILRVIKQQFPELTPAITSGLSLGEYTALTASGRLSFQDGVQLVSMRGQFMNEACEKAPGTMAVVLGLNADVVEKLVKEVNRPNDLWAANFNCPGQIVLSGTLQGIEAGIAAAKAAGARRVLPLQVHGAFHSGLMKDAGDRLAPYIQKTSFHDTACDVILNVPGNIVKDPNEIKECLIKQVTHSVRWEQGVRVMMDQGCDCYLEIGCGEVLTGFNKKIGVTAPCPNVDKVEDLKVLEELLQQ